VQDLERMPRTQDGTADPEDLVRAAPTDDDVGISAMCDLHDGPERRGGVVQRRRRSEAQRHPVGEPSTIVASWDEVPDESMDDAEALIDGLEDVR
jgi:hypothetical protein